MSVLGLYSLRAAAGTGGEDMGGGGQWGCICLQLISRCHKDQMAFLRGVESLGQKHSALYSEATRAASGGPQPTSRGLPARPSARFPGRSDPCGDGILS